MKDQKDESLRELLLAHLDGRLSTDEFDHLQRQLQADPAARADYVKLARLDAELREVELTPATKDQTRNRPWTAWFSKPASLAIAALLMLVLLGLSFLRPKSDSTLSAQAPESSSVPGVAVISAEAGAVWRSEPGVILRSGATLKPGRIVLEEGLAQIDFFGGTSISLSAPAELELLTADSAQLHRGRLRADVPPAGRGFEVRAGEVLIEDLGTSFGLSAGDQENAEVVVFDGEVRAIGRDGEPLALFEGDAALLQKGSASSQASTAGTEDYPDISEVISGAGSREARRYEAWKQSSAERRADPRLIAYYDFEGLDAATRRLRNRATEGLGSELDGGIVGARVAPGRWGKKTALDFRAEGDRVRFQIPGEFDAVTLFAWVRIDALDRNLNSLFLTDYFDENEIHWQLSREGHLHFAVSPMGAVDIPANNRRFFSDSFWTPAQSGNWFLLATTVERGAGKVIHYVNGKPLGFSGGTNMEKPVPSLRIGAADLGNWSDPIWPGRSLRTLNGRIDEFALYSVALTAREIETIFENGKP